MSIDYYDIFACGLFLVLADTATGAGIAIALYAIVCALVGVFLRKRARSRQGQH